MIRLDTTRMAKKGQMDVLKQAHRWMGTCGLYGVLRVPLIMVSFDHRGQAGGSACTSVRYNSLTTHSPKLYPNLGLPSGN